MGERFFVGSKEAERIKTPAFQRSGKLVPIGTGSPGFSNMIPKMTLPMAEQDLSFWSSAGEATAWGFLIFGTITFFEMLSERD